MDCQGSQAASSSGFFPNSSTVMDPSSSTFASNAGGFGPYPQARPYIGNYAAGYMAEVDMNAANGPYTQLLQGGFVPGGQGLQPLRIGPRSGAGQFNPPCPATGAGGSGTTVAARGSGRRGRGARGGASTGRRNRGYDPVQDDDELEEGQHSKDIELRNKLSMKPEDVTFQLLRQITDDFSDERILGRGAFGVVYKGVTETKEIVAVKRLSLSYDNPDLVIQQFRNEFDKLVMLKHQNIVQIFGYCFEIEKTYEYFNGMKVTVENIHIALCLEYLPNGSLQNHLSDDFCGLDWHTRYEIIKGICDGVKYIHEELEQPIYHLDLKPGNILLDENMLPKIADFGLSKIFNEELTRTTQSPLGTLGYQPPEYINRGEISKKFDIFSLGVMMIQIVSGPKGPSIHADMPNDKFIDFVKKIWRNNLPETCSRSFELYCLQIETCTQIALTCMEEVSQKRPNIVQIIHKLVKTEIGFAKLPETRGCHETTFGLTINNEMKNPRKESRKMIDEHQNFNLMTCSKYNELEFVDVRETSWNVGELIIGRKDEKNKLMDSLLKGMMPRIIIILPIYGIGGVGKTTFAELIYNDTKFKHYSRVWVHVSPRFDLNKIGNSIISQLSETGSLANERETISSCLTKLLSGKKILIVLDDLWEDNQLQLEDLKAMLNLGDSMNVLVLVTTRSESVARKICTNIEQPYKIKPLTDGMCWEIIRQSSGFDTRDNKEPELEDLGKEIARKCRGVALAAQSLGFMLQNMKCDQWSQVKDNDIWKDASLPNHVLVSLKLSYSFMDPHLKPCFTYCAIFPKGHKIDKDELIHQWISLGFVEPTILHSTIQLCEKYIEQLKGFSFIQPLVSPMNFEKYHEGAALFTMHDLVHDLATLLLGNQIFDQCKQDNAMGSSSCQYALLTDCSKPLELWLTSHERLIALRFLNCCRTELSGAAFAPASSLQVLDLSECSIQKLPDSIGQLKQLRYLNAPEIRDQMVPECITKLSNLMYLSFHGSSTILALPESIGQLEGLIYLDLSGCSGMKKLPESFGNLKNLEHVDFTNCYNVTGVSQCLERLRKLQYLNLSYCKNIGDLPVALGSLTELRYLSLSYSSYLNLLAEAEFLGSLTKLKYLNLSSDSLCIRRFPEALGSLTKLNYLNLSGFEKVAELPRSFKNLHSLVHLDLSYCRDLRHVVEAFSGFTKLQYLNLKLCSQFHFHEFNRDECLREVLDNLTELRYLNLCGFLESVPRNRTVDVRVLERLCTLTNLEYLNLSGNDSLYDIPEAIVNLGKLHTLELRSCFNLETLPACLSQMDSLKFVNIMDCNNFMSTQPLPTMLPHFRVHAVDDESSSNLFLLEGENPDALEITGLENVKSAEEAQGIKLVEKRRIATLELFWTRDEKRFVEDDEVLKELLPPKTVKLFTLSGYGSINFPSWVMGIATYLPNLTSITLWALPNCINLPPLGQLPKLKYLAIGQMDSISKIGGDFYEGTRAFPQLQILSLDYMEYLEDWNMLHSSSEDSLNEHMLPSLKFLKIEHCPRLRLKPWLAGTGGKDYYLAICSSDEVILSSWESRGDISTSSAKCTKLCVQRCAAPLCQWSLLGHLPCLTHLRIKRCQDLTCSSPDVLGGLPSLQKLVVSCCGRITSLPDCLGDLTSLEELRMHRCRSIKALPDSIQQLTNLQRLVISRSPNLQLWCQTGENKMKLAHIKELELMGDEELQSDIDLCSIKSDIDMDSDSDLESVQDSVHQSEHFLRITKLGNVKSAEEAQRIKLVEKRTLEKLELIWTRDDKRFMEDYEVLKELLPPDTVKHFKVYGYRSTNFPSWVMGIVTYLPYLTYIVLWNLPNCINLPPLGQLPELKWLVIGRMDSISKIGEDLYGGMRAFPQLQCLSLDYMECLEDWNMLYSSSEDSLNEHMLPSLKILKIEHCPRLRLKPWLAGAGGNNYCLIISSCDEIILSSWVGRGCVGASSAKCTKLHVKCCAAPLYQWSLLGHLPCLTHLWITRCQDLTCSSPGVLGGLPSLQKLVVSCCGRITSLPDCLGDLTSLEELRMHRCRSIKALPDSIQQLTNLQRLVISRSPNLELWCQTGENKMKLAHIKELELMGDEERESDFDPDSDSDLESSQDSLSDQDSDSDLESSQDSLSDHESENDQDSEIEEE